MKKVRLLFALAGMVCMLCACGKETQGDNASLPDEQVTLDNQQTDAPGDTDTNTNAQETPAKILAADFKAKVEEGMTTTQDLANAILSNPIIPFAPATMPVEPGFLTGFPEDEIKGFSEGTMFGPSIGSIPFVGYVFKVDGNAEEFAMDLLNKSDLRWNICTEADEKEIEIVDNLVFFVMSPATLGE